MTHRRTLLAAPLALAGCASLGLPPLTATQTQNLWAFAKGLGEVVLGITETLLPGIAPAIQGVAAIITAAEPLVETAWTNYQAQQQLEAHAKALILLAAPHVTVGASGT